MILFLDDSKERVKAFRRKYPQAVIAMTAEECINELSKDVEWEMVLLDHDLGDEQFVDSAREDCGMGVVRWIIDNQPFIRNIVIHSLNYPAASEMCKKLLEAKYHHTRHIPFTQLIDLI